MKLTIDVGILITLLGILAAIVRGFTRLESRLGFLGERVDQHQERLNQHDERLRALETGRPPGVR